MNFFFFFSNVRVMNLKKFSFVRRPDSSVEHLEANGGSMTVLKIEQIKQGRCRHQVANIFLKSFLNDHIVDGHKDYRVAITSVLYNESLRSRCATKKCTNFIAIDTALKKKMKLNYNNYKFIVSTNTQSYKP